MEPAGVASAAEDLQRAGRVLESQGRTLASADLAQDALPGGRTVTALRDGAARMAAAVTGEGQVVEACGADLASFVAAVQQAESDSVGALS